MLFIIFTNLSDMLNFYETQFPHCKVEITVVVILMDLLN